MEEFFKDEELANVAIELGEDALKEKTKKQEQEEEERIKAAEAKQNLKRTLLVKN